MSNEPIFYQHFTLDLFEGLLKIHTPVLDGNGCANDTIAKMTYEEENALRYIGGYIVRSPSQKFKRDKKKNELQALHELYGDETAS